MVRRLAVEALAEVTTTNQRKAAVEDSSGLVEGRFRAELVKIIGTSLKSVKNVGL